jgi:hypothetical protein
MIVDVSSDEIVAEAVLGTLGHANDPERHWWLYRRVLDDGRVLYLQQMLGNNLRISLSRDEHDVGSHSNYCFHDVKEAWRSALGWDGEGDPEGWVRHIETGRRRPDGDAEREYINP